MIHKQLEKNAAIFPSPTQNLTCKTRISRHFIAAIQFFTSSQIKLVLYAATTCTMRWVKHCYGFTCSRKGSSQCVEALAHTYHCQSGQWQEGEGKVVASVPYEFSRHFIIRPLKIWPLASTNAVPREFLKPLLLNDPPSIRAHLPTFWAEQLGV